MSFKPFRIIFARPRGPEKRNLRGDNPVKQIMDMGRGGLAGGGEKPEGLRQFPSPENLRTGRSLDVLMLKGLESDGSCFDYKPIKFISNFYTNFLAY